MNQELIEELRAGEAAVKYDGTLEELRIILRVAFPHDLSILTGGNRYYLRSNNIPSHWMSTSNIKIKSYSVKDFFVKVKSYKVKPEYVDFINSYTTVFKSFDAESYARDILEGAGVLDLWFDKVYEEKLPKIGCSQGEETQSHIKYGGKAISKKTLRHMEENGIVELTVERDGERFLIEEEDLRQIYKIAEK